MRCFQIPMVVAVTVALSPSTTFAQGAADYPIKTVRVIVGSGPGGGADQTARIFAQKLSESLKGQFVVDNRPGGGDTIATGLTAKAASDGYTLMVAGPSFTIAPSLYPNFLVDPVKDFAPISLSTKAPLLLVVHPSLPIKSVKELIALARSKPGALDFGTPLGGNTHLASAYLASIAKIKITFIPYKGGGQSVSAAIAGEVPVVMVGTLAAMPYVKSGRLRALGVSTKERSSLLPEVPTIAESGIPGYDVYQWAGWVAPAATPADIVNKLSAALDKSTKSPDVVKRISDDGALAVGGTPEQFGQLIAAEVPRWRKVVKDLDIRVE